MSVCILDRYGESTVHRNLQAGPETLLTGMAPSRDVLASAVECLFTWYWLADLCAQGGLPFVLGHALSKQAIPGGKAKTDKLDAHTSAAKLRDANTLCLLRPVPGSGESLSPVRLYEIHHPQRFPRAPAFVSNGRLVKCAWESAGQRSGTSGTKLGKASLTWAFSEAAALLLRTNPAGQTYLARLERNHGQGKAWTALAHKVARAVYDKLNRGRSVWTHFPAAKAQRR
jgi:hypothetical protein